MFFREQFAKTPRYLWVYVGVFLAFLVLALAGYPRSGFIVFVLANGLGWMWMKSLDRRRYQTAFNWPVTKATVEAAGVLTVAVSGQYGQPLIDNVVEVAYSYLASGEYRSGFQQRQFPSRVAAGAFIEAINGKTLGVHVNPRNPADTQLEESSLRGILPDPDTWGDPIGALQSR